MKHADAHMCGLKINTHGYCYIALVVSAHRKTTAKKVNGEREREKVQHGKDRQRKCIFGRTRTPPSETHSCIWENLNSSLFQEETLAPFQS